MNTNLIFFFFKSPEEKIKELLLILWEALGNHSYLEAEPSRYYNSMPADRLPDG